MSAYIYHKIYCDSTDVNGKIVCFNAVSGAGTATQVRALARSKGWLVGQPGGKDYCPDHRIKAKD